MKIELVARVVAGVVAFFTFSVAVTGNVPNFLLNLGANAPFWIFSGPGILGIAAYIVFTLEHYSRRTYFFVFIWDAFTDRADWLRFSSCMLCIFGSGLAVICNSMSNKLIS